MIGLNANGKTTDKADKALTTKLADYTGKVVITDTLAEIAKLYGQRLVPIPTDTYLKEFGATKSFRIDINVSWVMIQLKLPAGFPGGLVLIGVPTTCILRAAGPMTANAGALHASMNTGWSKQRIRDWTSTNLRFCRSGSKNWRIVSKSSAGL